MWNKYTTGYHSELCMWFILAGLYSTHTVVVTCKSSIKLEKLNSIKKKITVALYFTVHKVHILI